MKQLFCETCGTLVAELADGSRVLKTATVSCGKHAKPKLDPPDFFKTVFGPRV